MSELFDDKDPQLQAVIDKQSLRNLLDPSNPNPLVVDTRGGKAVRFAIQVANGPEGLINLKIASDQPWLQPEANHLTLVGGERSDLIVSAGHDGQGEFAQLSFSWEGTKSTLSQSVLVQRQVPAGTAKGSAGPQPGLPSDREERIKKLNKFIQGCGGKDKFIDYKEEQRVFAKGGDLEFSLNETEALLNKQCTEGGWTRETRLRETLAAQLVEATKDDGVVDKAELDAAVNFAVRRNMPRRDALELCVTIMLDKNLRPKKNWFGKSVIDDYRKTFGL
jgi:hypothetical protein